MKIKIATKLRPFTHTTGMPMMLPGSTIAVTAFPTSLEFRDLTSATENIIRLRGTEGGVDDFMVVEDLEKGRVTVSGKSNKGVFRYSIVFVDEAISIVVEKGDIKFFDLPKGFVIKDSVPKMQIPIERLSLGCHKKQDWDLVTRRLQLDEILPHLLRLGSMMHSTDEDIHDGTFSLLDECSSAILSRDKEAISPALQNLIKGAFYGIMVPRVSDGHQGLISEGTLPSESCAPQLLLRTSDIIHSLFIHQEGTTISLLPMLPIELHCGRFVDVSCGDIGTISFEWTKKLLRRAIFRSTYDGPVTFNFQNALKTFRLRTSAKGRGTTVSCGDNLDIKAGIAYYLDNFCK